MPGESVHEESPNSQDSPNAVTERDSLERRSRESDIASSLSYSFGPVTYDFFSRTHLMGVLNVTPDSFSDGGTYFDPAKAIEHGLHMVADGADFIDVGGESSRPGADPVSLEEELRRVIPVIEKLAAATTVPISIDTYKHEVAARALEAGACIVNDISGLHIDPSIAAEVARHHATIILMHMQGTPQTMQLHPHYENLVEEISLYLDEGIRLALDAGIGQIIIDPGIGFGKNLKHNLTIFKRLREFQDLGYPVMIGPSRKSFLKMLLDLPVDKRLEGSAAAVAVSIMNGAQIIRVHDVKEMKRVATVVDAIVKG